RGKLSHVEVRRAMVEVNGIERTQVTRIRGALTVTIGQLKLAKRMTHQYGQGVGGLLFFFFFLFIKKV
ncbi:hypothetical protein QO216_23410, partial [Vibrio vulnificus]|uniref:hypothetical protein n=1 Tax=Vibrio vulnificus TaxID=672 RepID=UPI0024DF9B15